MPLPTNTVRNIPKGLVCEALRKTRMAAPSDLQQDEVVSGHPAVSRGSSLSGVLVCALEIVPEEGELAC